MEKTTYKRVSFDIELAKKIQSEEVEGRIVTGNNELVRIICFDRNCGKEIIPCVALVMDDDTEQIFIANSHGLAVREDDKDLSRQFYIELIEETPKHKFKVGNKVIIVSTGESGEIKNIYEYGVIVRVYGKYDYTDCDCSFSNIEPYEEKHEFKPFDKVLVREDDLTSWQAAFFSHIESFEDGERFAITTSGDNYNLANNEIIPYEGNEHLVGTTNNPE